MIGFSKINGKAVQVSFLWLADLHLDACSEKVIERFCVLSGAYNSLVTEATAVISTGDFGQDESRLDFFRNKFMSETFYCVPGELDVNVGGEPMRRLKKTPAPAYFMLKSPMIAGCEVRPDGRAGLMEQPVSINGFFTKGAEKIQLISKDRKELRKTMMGWGTSDASMISGLFTSNKEAVRLLVSHFPMFEANLMVGKDPMPEQYHPYMLAQHFGKKLLETEHGPTIVLSGHTHSWSDVVVGPGIRSMTAEAEFGYPTIQGIFYLVDERTLAFQRVGLGELYPDEFEKPEKQIMWLASGQPIDSEKCECQEWNEASGEWKNIPVPQLHVA